MNMKILPEKDMTVTRLLYINVQVTKIVQSHFQGKSKVLPYVSKPVMYVIVGEFGTKYKKSPKLETCTIPLG